MDWARAAETHLIGGQGTGLSINNATSTKQNVDHTTGLLVLAKGDDAGSTPTLAYYAMIDLTAGTPPPTITSFTATPASITSGQTSTLAWTTTNATSVTINPGGLTGGASGNVVVSPTTTTTYTLAATGPGGGPCHPDRHCHRHGRHAAADDHQLYGDASEYHQWADLDPGVDDDQRHQCND